MKGLGGQEEAGAAGQEAERAPDLPGGQGYPEGWDRLGQAGRRPKALTPAKPTVCSCPPVLRGTELPEGRPWAGFALCPDA